MEVGAMVTSCLFVKDWECPVGGDEIPLEVCRVCSQTKSTAQRKPITVAREAASMAVGRERVKELAVGGEKPGSGEPLTPGEREDALRELNRRFIKGEIPAPDYVNERAALTLGKRE